MSSRELEHLYRKAVHQIAFNEDPSYSRRDVEASISVQLVADVFDRTPRQVASAVLRLRRAYDKGSRHGWGAS